MSTWKEMARLIGMPDEVIDSRKANNRANVLKSPCYTLAWAVVLQLFHVTYSAELLDLAGALQNDIVELGVLVLKLLMDPRLATRPAVDSDGFKVLRLDVLITADEPAPSLRKPILAALKKIKAGSGKRYCDLVDIIGERAYSILIGKVCNPGPTNNGDAALGFIVPACFVGKSNGVQVKQKDWNDADVEATMKRASELWAAAWGVGGKPIAGADLGDTNIQNAGVMYLHGVCDYEGYHYAKCICAYPSFAALMMKLYSSEPTATVTMANLKGTGRYNAKLNQYTHEGKSQPASQFVKDVIRCLVQTAGHQEMQHAAGLLEKKEGKPPLLSLLTDKQTEAKLEFVQASKKLGETSHSVDWPNGGQMSGAGAAPTRVTAGV